MTEKQNFIQAVKDDEYAEYELPCGAILITDWESDGVFNPHVVTTEIKYDVEDVGGVVGDEIAEAFDVRVRAVEVSSGGHGAYPIMDRPTA